MDLILEAFEDLENKIIILGGNFNLFLDSVLETPVGNPILKKSFVLKFLEMKEKFNILDIWRIRNAKNIVLVLYRVDYILILFQMFYKDQSEKMKCYQHCLLTTLQFYFL